MRKLWLLVIVVVMVQCDNEDPKNETCKLIRQKYAELAYNDEGRLVTLVQTNDNQEPVSGGYRREFEYDNDDRLVLIDEFQGTNLSRTFTFDYSEGQILQKEYWFQEENDPELPDYTVAYTLNSENKVIQLDHEDLNTGLLRTHTYEYEGQNVVKMTSVSDEPSLNYVQEFEFDNYLNPNALEGFELHWNDNIFNNLTQNKNNYTKITTTNPGSAPTVVTLSYSYNSNNYPKERFANGSITASWFFEYECR